jgi:hypothetical protein
LKSLAHFEETENLSLFRLSASVYEKSDPAKKMPMSKRRIALYVVAYLACLVAIGLIKYAMQ